MQSETKSPDVEETLKAQEMRKVTDAFILKMNQEFEKKWKEIVQAGKMMEVNFQESEKILCRAFFQKGAFSAVIELNTQSEAR
jgi:hypothetical protein